MHQRTKIAVAVALAINSMTVFAQTAEPALQRVEVTGSRIRAVDLETAQPVQVMSQEQIQKSGLITVGDILNNLTSAAPPTFSKGSVLTSNREQGGQYIDMRNLGANRLLVLVNGKRWTQTVAGYTDLSTIPSSMIERLEILKDGASSIYGSDAIAGVVNVILKKSLEGGTVSVYAGQNEKGDGETQDANLSYGTSNDKASMMFGLTFSKTKPVWAKDRPITATTFGPDHPTTGLVGGPWGRISPVNPATGGALTSAAAGGFNNYLNHTGSVLGDGVGANSRDRNNYHAYTGATDDTFSSPSQMMFQSPTQLASMFTKGSIELPHGIRFTTTALFAERTSSAQVAGYPLGSLSQAGYPVYVDKDSYYNPYGNQGIGTVAGTGRDIFFTRRTIEQPRVTTNKNRTVHVDAGFEGDLQLGTKAWNWSTGFNYSSSGGNVMSTGNINLVNLKKALGPSFLNASGQVQCGTAAAPIGFATCTPFDILGGPSASTPEAIKYVMSTGQATYSSAVKSVTADIAGEVFTLPAGQVGVAAGLEHRTVTGSDIPGQFEQSGLSTNLAGNNTFGKYTVKEAYAELQIPVLKNFPFAELLNFNIASRYSDYSNFGDTTNSKFSFMWKPVKDVLTRGTYAQGFRAPSLGDTFGGGSQSFDSYIDPCDTVNGEYVRNATVKARCDLVVPAGYRQTNAAGLPVPASGAQTTVAFNSGAGNDSLTPETATTKTLGLVYSPSFISGASISLDWFNISVKNRITAIGATYTVNQCFINGVQSFCDKFKRDVTGKIVQLNRGNANLGELSTEGLDIGLKYKMKRNAFGQFSFTSESTYVDSYKTKSTADGEFIEYAGNYGFNRFKSNLAVDWNMGNWSATFMTRFQSKVKTDCQFATECNTPDGEWSEGTGYDVKKSLVYNDMSIGYAFPWKGKLLVGANNMFDKKPRINYSAGSAYGGNSSSSSVDPDAPIDRFFYVRYNQSF
jgi:iron complex outermembrane receptor protein